MTEIMEPEVKSTHKAEVVPFKMEKHPNADTLSIVQVYGYTCCVRTEDWPANTAKAVYIPPDSIVEVTRPEFAFLTKDSKDGKTARVKARKLRTIESFGCLVPCPEDAQIGDDLAERLCVKHYEPPEKGTCSDPKQRLYAGGEVAKGPDVFTVKYDVDAFRRYHQLFVKDEPVMVTEKLDGANARYVYHDGQMYCGSRTEWKKEYPDYSHVTVEHLVAHDVPEERAKMIVDNLQNKPKKRNMWWEILDRTPILAIFCNQFPGYVVYGEVYGNVGRIKYGVPDGFAAFDVMAPVEAAGIPMSKWVSAVESRIMLTDGGVPCVPLIAANLPYDFDKICELASGPTCVPGAKEKTIREGIVVKPCTERRDPHVGRVQLKCVSSEYLEKY